MLFYFIGQPVGKQGDLSISKINALNYLIFLTTSNNIVY